MAQGCGVALGAEELGSQPAGGMTPTHRPPNALNINARAFVPASFTKSHTQTNGTGEQPPTHGLVVADHLDLLALPCEVRSSGLFCGRGGSWRVQGHAVPLLP